MNTRDDDIRAALRRLADQPAAVCGQAVGVRAIRAVRRRRLITATAAVVLVALLGAGTWAVAPWDRLDRATPILPAAPAPSVPAASADRLAVVGYRYGDPAPQTMLRDPDTGQYRPGQSYPAAASPDLRYALTTRIQPSDAGADAPTPYRCRIVDLTTGATLHQWDTENALAGAWSPDGRHVAVTHVTGLMEDRYIDRVDVLDVTTGRTRRLELPGKVSRRASTLLSWSADSRSLYLTAGIAGHYRLDLDGTATYLRGAWTRDYSALGVVPGTDTALLTHSTETGPDTADWLVYDLATGTIASRYRPAPAAVAARNGLVAVPRPDHLAVVTGSTLSVLDARTGTTLNSVTLPTADTTVLLAPTTDRGPLTFTR